MKSKPSRKTNRLSGYDYSRNGTYFITVCVKDRHELLWNDDLAGAIPNRPPILSAYGLIVDDAIKAIPVCYPSVLVDKYVIMPNHIHIILIINNENGRLGIAPTVSTIIQQTKRRVSKQIRFSFWQKSFYDHIIRNDGEYQRIWQYIDSNPTQWEKDEYYARNS